jgi:dipeptidyl aminopeptidase/acylaminoacyl peptidase
MRRESLRLRASSRIGLALLGLVLAAAQAPAQTPAPASPAPIDAFTRWDEFGSIKISPDGEFVALSTGKYGRSVIAFVDLKNKKVGGGVRAPEPFEIYDYFWVSPTRIVYQIAERYPGSATPVFTGEIFAINRDGSSPEQIYGYRAGQRQLGTRLKVRESSFAHPDIVSLLREDRDNILITEQPWKQIGMYWAPNWDAKPRITRLNVYNGDKRDLGSSPLRSATVLVDQSDRVRFAIGLNDAMKLAVSWKPEPDADWTEFEVPGFREEGVEPRRFSADNNSVLFTGVRDGESLSSLYSLNLQTRAIEKVHGFDGVEVTGVVADFTDRETVGVRGYGAREQYHWLKADDPAAKLHAALQRAFKDQSVTITSASDDGQFAIVYVSSDVNPGDYYLFDTKTMRADYLRAARVWVDPRTMRPRRPFEFAARDGLKLQGYVTAPEGAGPHPLVVLPHGGPHGIRDYWEFDWEAQLLASRGYAVLQLNFRGSGGFGMDFQAVGYRQWGVSMQDDVTDATKWAIEQKIAQPDRICIFGGSYGGYAALMGAAREPDLYRCAVGYAGVYDLELMLTSADIPDSRSGQAYLVKALGTDVADLRARSPVHHAQHIKAPVLLIHGAKDWRADYEQATRMKEALQQHSKSLEWLALSREGHGVYDEATRKEVYERILAFLDKHLKSENVAAR